MAKNIVPEARDGLNTMKNQTATEVGVTLQNGYNGNITSAQAGKIGGNMVKKMVEQYERNI
jgi:small acid-soluble spore protein D (minor alpha/beta-type SASP)